MEPACAVALFFSDLSKHCLKSSFISSPQRASPALNVSDAAAGILMRPIACIIIRNTSHTRNSYGRDTIETVWKRAKTELGVDWMAVTSSTDDTVHGFRLG